MNRALAAVRLGIQVCGRRSWTCVYMASAPGSGTRSGKPYLYLASTAQVHSPIELLRRHLQSKHMHIKNGHASLRCIPVRSPTINEL